MIKIVTIVGARPQIIKAAAISRAIKQSFNGQIEEKILHTGQHYDLNMSENFFKEMEIPTPSANLNVGSNTPSVQTAKMIEGISNFLDQEKPHCVVIYGDTNSTLAGSVAASQTTTPLVHVEAGLRSYNKNMPEENNRIVCDHLSTLLFCPTNTAINNLAKEGLIYSRIDRLDVNHPGIYHCGDVMYDNSIFYLDKALKKSTILEELNLKENNFILMTIHRNYNTDNIGQLKKIVSTLIKFCNETSEKIVLPLHPRTLKNISQFISKEEMGVFQQKVKIIDPVPFFDMINLEYHSKVIITDSGGVQKEAYFFKKPVLILRSETEWVEIIENGAGRLVKAEINNLLENYHYFQDKTVAFVPIFGDGNAAKTICEKILLAFK